MTTLCLDDDDLALFHDNGEALVSIKTFNRLCAVPGALAAVAHDADGTPCLYGEEDYRDFDGTAQSVLIKCRLASTPEGLEPTGP